MDTVEGSLFYIGKRQRYRKDVSDFPEKERQNGKKAGIGRSQALHFLRRLREYLSEECDSRMEGAFREGRGVALHWLYALCESLSRRLHRHEGKEREMKKRHRWYDWLWIWELLYFSLGFFNILFAWLGMLDFLLPLLLAIFGGNKLFCNHLCGRGQLFQLLGTKGRCSRNRPTPRWMSSRAFRYGFLIFFMTMFGNMLFQTWLVFGGSRGLREVLKLFWTIRVPWGWTYTAGTVPDWIAQFSFGFYSMMLTSTLIGLIVMLLYKPRSWCTFCPMGSMTQSICEWKHRELLHFEEKSA